MFVATTLRITPCSHFRFCSGKASWELDPGEQQRIDDRHKGRARHGDDEEDDDVGEESLAQVLLSYAGLVAALLVILLGILFMIGAKATN